MKASSNYQEMTRKDCYLISVCIFTFTKWHQLQQTACESIKHWHYSFIKLDSHALPHEQEHGWEILTRTCHKNNHLILCGASFKAQGMYLLCWYILTESTQNEPCVLSLVKSDIHSLLFFWKYLEVLGYYFHIWGMFYNYLKPLLSCKVLFLL